MPKMKTYIGILLLWVEGPASPFILAAPGKVLNMYFKKKNQIISQEFMLIMSILISIAFLASHTCDKILQTQVTVY